MAIGLMGLFFMVVSDAIAGLVVYEEGWGGWAWRTGKVDIVEGLVGLAFFTLMPALWMLGEGATDEMGETAHGHEKKPVVDAVPKVVKIEKESKAVNGNGSAKAKKTN